MAKTNPELAKINGYKNLTVKTRKSDGERRRVNHNSNEIGDILADCSTPAEIGQVAVDNGIRAEEVLERAKAAPNFGQFRMVIGNRVMAVVRRLKNIAKPTADDIAAAAYPKEASAARRAAKKAEREKAKAEKPAKPSKVAKKATKKVSKKKGKGKRGHGIKVVDGDEQPLTKGQVQAEEKAAEKAKAEISEASAGLLEA